MWRKKTKTSRVVDGELGDACPRCGHATEVREHKEITDRQLRQPYYFARWFHCTNVRCRTTLIMPDRYRVYRNQPAPVSSTVADMVALPEADGKLPWED
jgi:hypothetical protein